MQQLQPERDASVRNYYSILAAAAATATATATGPASVEANTC